MFIVANKTDSRKKRIKSANRGREIIIKDFIQNGISDGSYYDEDDPDLAIFKE